MGGIGLCLTVIGIPFGLQSIKPGLPFLPVRKEVVELGEGTALANHLQRDLAAAGWEIALAHLTSAALLAITIIIFPSPCSISPIPLSLFGRAFRPIRS